MKTKIIFTADDAGILPQIDNAIVDLANRGILNSAEVLPNYGNEGDKSIYNAKQIITQIKTSGNPLELGVHLTITSGSPITQSGGLDPLRDEQGRFRSYRDIPSNADPEALYQELKAQAEILLSNDTLRPYITHLTNHHDALWFYPEYTLALVRLADELNFPIRNTRTIPESKGWIYYVFQNLLRGISQADKNKIKEAYNLRADGYFPKQPLQFESTDYMDNRHYEVNHLWDDFDPRDARIVIRRKKRKLKDMIEKAGSYSAPDGKQPIVEFMFHVRKGKILDYSGLEELPYYNGIDPRYFDGRTLEYRSLRDNQRVVERQMEKHNCEIGLWDSAKTITMDQLTPA